MLSLPESAADGDNPKSCGVLLVCGEPISSFLLMKHADRWDLPKGHVDPGESEMDCALREMEEETGICRDRVRIDPDFRFEHRYLVNSARTGWQEKLKTLVIFLGRMDEPCAIAVTEHADSQWHSWPTGPIQARTIDPLLQALENYLRNRGG